MLFKPGFTIKPFKDKTAELKYFGIDENLVWENGISITQTDNSGCR